MKAEQRALLDKLNAKQRTMQDVLVKSQDGTKHDFSRTAVLDALGAKSRQEALDRFKELHAEIKDLGEEISQMEIAEAASDVAEIKSQRQAPAAQDRSYPELGLLAGKSVGQLLIETKAFQERGRQKTFETEIDVSMKALFQTTTGFPPESRRSGLVVPAPEHNLQEILALIPVFPISQAAFVYMEETVHVPGAAEVAEGVTYGEAEYSYEEKTNPVRKIGDSIPVTDEQLEDEGTVASLLDVRLREGVMRRLARQILQGNGAGANFRGFLNTTGVQAQPLGADSIMSAIFKAITNVRVIGQAEPDAVILHPLDFQQIVLAQEVTGPYIFGHPAFAPMTRIWGLPIALSVGITEGTALTGAFRAFARLDERRGLDVQTGFVGDQFKQGRKTLRADVRAAFTITRPAAFSTVTGV